LLHVQPAFTLVIRSQQTAANRCIFCSRRDGEVHRLKQSQSQLDTLSLNAKKISKRHRYTVQQARTLCSLPLSGCRQAHRCLRVKLSNMRKHTVSLVFQLCLVCLVSCRGAAASAAPGTDCDSVLPALCKLNGAGSHCHPCVASAYVECKDSSTPELKSCPSGEQQHCCHRGRNGSSRLQSELGTVDAKLMYKTLQLHV
jgi:hypothetical protein